MVFAIFMEVTALLLADGHLAVTAHDSIESPIHLCDERLYVFSSSNRRISDSKLKNTSGRVASANHLSIPFLFPGFVGVGVG